MSDFSIDQKSKTNLLRLARKTIKKQFKSGMEENNGESVSININAGAFVTIHKHDELRGCIGTFSSDRPLSEVIQDMAIASAFNDPRFPPLKKHELNEIDIEISVLSPLKETKNVNAIEVGNHGIYITNRFRSGVLLPQVAVEQGWDRDTFLAHTCIKAGLPTDAWKDPETRIEIFTAEVFGEKDIE